jgi:hypothetical protein
MAWLGKTLVVMSATGFMIFTDLRPQAAYETPLGDKQGIPLAPVKLTI